MRCMQYSLTNDVQDVWSGQPFNTITDHRGAHERETGCKEKVTVLEMEHFKWLWQVQTVTTAK